MFSWILVGIITAEPQLQDITFSFFLSLSVCVCVCACVCVCLQHVEVPRLGVELELQLLAYTTATAMQDPSHIRDPHHIKLYSNAGSLTH